ncbi:hypothetical protein TNCV_405081 [Trichonephila clavipes]|nr:hypothetical protein TNCV_405081 [Trichonephila clavipes]
MFKAVKHYRERKILSGINVSKKAGKVSKKTNALEVHRLLAPLKTLKSFLRRFSRRFQSADDVKSASQAKLKHPTWFEDQFFQN